jgi:membrane protease YdiL (CAAX protease family)
MTTSDQSTAGAFASASPAHADAPYSSSRPVAGALHTLVLLAILGTWAYFGRLNAIHMRAEAHPNHLFLYGKTLLFEWVVFAYIVFGVRRHGVSLREVIGPRWTKASEILRDVGIAAAFELCALLVLGFVGRLLQAGSNVQNVRFMAPAGGLELAVWLMLSITAGICEETIFRGYLQRQFTGWTRNVVAGVLVSGALFGAAHIYQGGKQAIIIGVYGTMFGALAAFRRSLKPGMMAHAFQDSAAGVAMILAAKYKLGVM